MTRSKRWAVTALALAGVLGLAAAGYSIGKEMALRDNRAEAHATGNR